MGKYSLIVKNTLDNSIHYINTMNLDTLKWEKNVNLKDIDYWTSQFPDKFSFLENLYNLGIIDFKYGNTYIETIYGGRDYHFKNLYNNSKLNDIASSTENGEIKNQELADEQIKEFFALMARENFMNKLDQTKYMTKTIKRKLINYMETASSAKIRPEEICKMQILYFDIRKEFMRYKSFRGMILFMNEYELEYNYRFDRTKHPVTQKKSSIIDNVKPKDFLNDMQDSIETERYNQQYDEFLSEKEYNEAYQGKEENWHPHRR